MLAKNCWIVFTLVAATAAGHAAAQGGAVAKGATEPLIFIKAADARVRALSAPGLQSMFEGDFAVALADLDGDGRNEIIVKAELSSMYCGSDGACATVVLQQRGKRMLTLLQNQNTFDPLALTHAKYGGYRALAFVDEKGRIQTGDRPGTPLYGKPMLYLMQAPRSAAAQR